MKRRILECPIHGQTPHRCKRVYWMTGNISFDYTEKCCKCLLEGRVKKKKVEVKKVIHIKNRK